MPVRIVDAKYHAEKGLDLFVLKLSDGRRLALPREEIQFVAGASAEEAANFTIEPRGIHIWWTGLDEGLHLDGLLAGRTGNDAWMERRQRHAVAA